MKRVKAIVLTLLVGTLITVSGCSSSNSNENASKRTQPKVVNNIVEAPGVVKSHNIENIVMDAGNQAVIKVNSLNVKEGQKVKKGDKLLGLDLSQINYEIKAKQNTVAADTALKGDMQTDNQKRSQEAKIAAEQADLDALNSILNKSYLSGEYIISDMDNAVVTELNYKKGDILSAQQKVLSLQDLNALYVEAQVGEEFIKDVKVGSKVTMVPTSDSSLKLTGKVVSIASEAVTQQNGETNIPVEISIEGNSTNIYPNYNVDVKIEK